MTTGKPSPFRWTRLSASLLTAALLPGLAWAATPAEPTAPSSRTRPVAAADEDLYLEVTLNSMRSPQVRHFVMRGGRFHADEATLRAIGLTWPSSLGLSGLIALDSLPGLRSSYDEAQQQLSIVVPIALLDRPVSEFGYRSPPPASLDAGTRAPGLLFNYDVYAQGNDDARSASAWNELRVFGIGRGVFSNSSVLQAMDSRQADDRSRAIRLDTSLQLDYPDTMVTTVLGDTYGASLGWTRASRFGGLRISRNFSLQPYRVTVPLAAFAGETALPSTVDLLINGIREAQAEVTPGQFQIAAAPVLNGTGNAQVVITDITGQRRVIDFSLYNSPRLLQEGLTDWSVETGHLRRGYGIDSFDYADNPMATGSIRHGLSNRLTLEGHAEATEGLGMAGIGAQWLLGETAGVIGASYAGSRHAAQSGNQYGLRYEWQAGRFNASAGTLRRDTHFRDVASLEGSLLPRRTDQIVAGISLGRSQLGASYVRQDPHEGRRSRYASLSWSRNMSEYGYLSFNLSRSIDGGGGTSFQVYWSLPVGSRYQTWASAEHRNTGNQATVGAMRTLSDEDGWGWRVQASAGDTDTGEGEIRQQTRFGEWRAGFSRWQGNGAHATTGYAGASGALLLMESNVFAMRRVYDGFALVSTDGIADVPVMLENRPVGRTDEHGLLLVPQLNAWQNNKVSIDPLVLPADVSVDHVEAAVVPASRSGALARFPMRAITVVELSVRGPDGQWVPPGTRATLEPGDLQVTIGYDGRAYLENPPAGSRMQVGLRGKPCFAALPATLPARGHIDLGEVQCR